MILSGTLALYPMYNLKIWCAEVFGMRFDCYISHHIPGRIRIRFSGISPRQLEQIRKQMTGIPAVKSAEGNPLTGSILISYSAEKVANFPQTLHQRIPDLNLVINDRTANAVGDYSTVATSLLRTLKQADDDVRMQTAGLADLKLLFPLAVIGLAAITLPTTLQTPLWLSFLMFGWSSFESMHAGALNQSDKSAEEHESKAAEGASQG
jgi:hypothetical protein